MWAVVEIAPVDSVDPFVMPSRSIGQLRGNRTFVGRVVLRFLVLSAGLKFFTLVTLDIYSSNPAITEISSCGSMLGLFDDYRLACLGRPLDDRRVVRCSDHLTCVVWVDGSFARLVRRSLVNLRFPFEHVSK